jgi:elongation factor P
MRLHCPTHRAEDNVARQNNPAKSADSTQQELPSRIIHSRRFYVERWSGRISQTTCQPDKINCLCLEPAFRAGFSPRLEGVIVMAIPATQLRPGMVIKHNNDLHSVFSVEHRTPGNLRAFIQAKLRNLRTGAMFEHRFRSSDAIEKITVDETQMEFLYQDGDSYVFMNTENYEQLYLGKDVLGDAVDYLTPNLQIKVEFFDSKPVGVELPQTVDLKVVETEPGLKSATASSVTKPAKTETGLVVQVPPFINEGETIRVDTSEGAYLSRA